MSNKEALDIFVRKHVTTEMVDYLVSVTQSIIKVKSPETGDTPTDYPTPPGSPSSSKPKRTITLKSFIINLIRYSNVQVPTLMATLVYLNRLREILPSDQIYGIETTHHRIFIGCLILTAKYVNDSSPLNKHWARYSSGLLTIKELNVIEVEVLSYLDWDLSITNDDLYECLSLFLAPIKSKLRIKQEEELLKKQKLEQQQKIAALSKPTFKSLKHSASFTSIKKMFCPPYASSTSTFNSDNLSVSPTSSLTQSLSNNSSVSSFSSPVKNITNNSTAPSSVSSSLTAQSKSGIDGYTLPSLTNSASTYQSTSNSSSSYSLTNNSSTSSLTKKMIDEDFSFVEPPHSVGNIKAANNANAGVTSAASGYSIFTSPRNLLARLTSPLHSPKAKAKSNTNTYSPLLYKISTSSDSSSVVSLNATGAGTNGSTTATATASSKLMSPLSTFRSKKFAKKATGQATSTSTATIASAAVAAPAPAAKLNTLEAQRKASATVAVAAEVASSAGSGRKDIRTVKCLLAQPPDIHKNANMTIKNSVSSDNLKHFIVGNTNQIIRTNI